MRAYLQELDDEIMGAMVDEGLADNATYTAPGIGELPVPVRVEVDDVRLESEGDIGPGAVGTRREITLLREEVPTPERGGLVGVDGGVWKLEAKVFGDDSRSTWVVLRVRA